MLRIVRLAVFTGMLLATCTAWVFADTARPCNRVASESKPMYSNRPVGYTVPVPYYGTPMAPRFFVPPSAVQQRSVAMVPRVPQTTMAVTPVTPVPVRVPQTPQMLPAGQLAAPQVIERSFILREPLPGVNVKDELDSFYARLAKIQLEQRRLPDALALIQKINSETFRVRTVVSLAEYVSRDRSYQTEAEHLYRLAIAGMEALDQGRPFRIDLDGAEDVRPPIESPTVETRSAPLPPEPSPPTVVQETEGESLLIPFAPDPPVAAPLETETPSVSALLFSAPLPSDTPPGVSQGDAPRRPPLFLDEDAGRNRLPPPAPPPRGNGVDGGIVVSPLEQPPVSPVAPPARTTENNGPIPRPPSVSDMIDEVSPPDSSMPTPTLAPNVTTNPVLPESPPFVRPSAGILLVDEEEAPITPAIAPRQEAAPTPSPQPARRVPRTITLDEN